MSEPVTLSVPLREYVSEEVRALLGRRRMTNVELAAQLGKSRTYVGRRLGGEVAWDLDDLEAISRILRVKLTDLLPERPAGNSPWYDHPEQAAIGRAPDQATRRPRDSRPASRPNGQRSPIAATGVLRPRRRYATLPDAHRRSTTDRIPA